MSANDPSETSAANLAVAMLAKINFPSARLHVPVPRLLVEKRAESFGSSLFELDILLEPAL
jgi:hypothetical protein